MNLYAGQQQRRRCREQMCGRGWVGEQDTHGRATTREAAGGTALRLGAPQLCSVTA